MSSNQQADTQKTIATAEQAISSTRTLPELEQVRLQYLGKQGEISQAMRQIGSLPADERPQAGNRLQQVRQQILEMLQQRQNQLETAADADQLAADKLDITLPGRSEPAGARHLINQLMEEVSDWFCDRGWQLADGPEVEDNWHNFTALNMGEDHPARNMHDTFYFDDGLLLRTHTSPVQIRTMKVQQPPLSIICPGRVYRRDLDLTHTPMFHQVEGLAVDRDISFAQLKGLLRAFLSHLFGPDRPLRFRASFFPFTSPSTEVDLQCAGCAGSGCRICKDGWLEVLGAGMVHPEVLRNCDLDPEQWSGFAFGLGIERLAMLLHGLGDMRLCFENDLRLLHQFRR